MPMGPDTRANGPTTRSIKTATRLLDPIPRSEWHGVPPYPLVAQATLRLIPKHLVMLFDCKGIRLVEWSTLGTRGRIDLGDAVAS